MKRRSTINLNNLRNLIKLFFLIFICLILFIIFLYFYFKVSDYETQYSINDIKVTEYYHKAEEYYEFKLNYNKKEYVVVSTNKYINKRNLITDIKIDKQEDDICLMPVSSDINLYEVCSNKDGFYLKSELSAFEEKRTYENIKINTLDNHTFILWNYKDFLYLSPKKETKISLFNKDIYSLNLIYQTNNELIVPDYNENYKFDKVYVINSNNAKYDSLKLRYELYFDSYFLGDYEKKVYIYDFKQSSEYYIDLKKKDINKTKYKILVDNKWESVSNQKLKNDKLTFSSKENFNYVLEDNKLYFNINNKYLVRENVDKIVFTSGLEAFYLSKDVLYSFNLFEGEKALLKYSEWEFNNNNMIFIFNN